MKDLGKMHDGMGVKIEHFPAMGEGLFHALEVVLKHEFNEETREAWRSAYGRLASKMVSAMRSKKQC